MGKRPKWAEGAKQRDRAATEQEKKDAVIAAHEILLQSHDNAFVTAYKKMLAKHAAYIANASGRGEIILSFPSPHNWSQSEIPGMPDDMFQQINSAGLLPKLEDASAYAPYSGGSNHIMLERLVESLPVASVMPFHELNTVISLDDKKTSLKDAFLGAVGNPDHENFALIFDKEAMDTLKLDEVLGIQIKRQGIEPTLHKTPSAPTVDQYVQNFSNQIADTPNLDESIHPPSVYFVFAKENPLAMYRAAQALQFTGQDRFLPQKGQIRGQ